MLTNKSYRVLLVMLGIATVSTFLAGLATCIPVAPLDVGALTNSADRIVVGRVVSVANNGSGTVEFAGGVVSVVREVASLQVDKVIKGEAGSGALSFQFWVPNAPVGFQSISPGQYGIFFLRRKTPMPEVLDPTHAVLPALSGVEITGGTLLDEVTSTLLQVLVAPGATEPEVLGALGVLTTIRTDSATDGSRSALETRSGQLRLRIADRLVARNDLAGLEPVADALQHSAGLPEQLISELAGSLGGLRDPQSVPTLRGLLETNDQRVLQGAAIALRQTHSREALEPLSTLLSNGDQRVRYYAVVGMGEITGQDKWTPAFDEFREHEARYLSYWRDWSASNLGRGAP